MLRTAGLLTIAVLALSAPAAARSGNGSEGSVAKTSHWSAPKASTPAVEAPAPQLKPAATVAKPATAPVKRQTKSHRRTAAHVKSAAATPRHDSDSADRGGRPQRWYRLQWYAPLVWEPSDAAPESK